jgi:hypothetical protein
VTPAQPEVVNTKRPPLPGAMPNVPAPGRIETRGPIGRFARASDSSPNLSDEQRTLVSTYRTVAADSVRSATSRVLWSTLSSSHGAKGVATQWPLVVAQCVH